VQESGSGCFKVLFMGLVGRAEHTHKYILAYPAPGLSAYEAPLIPHRVILLHSIKSHLSKMANGGF
jgi:hypothetical protein